MLPQGGFELVCLSLETSLKGPLRSEGTKCINNALIAEAAAALRDIRDKVFILVVNENGSSFEDSRLATMRRRQWLECDYLL